MKNDNIMIKMGINQFMKVRYQKNPEKIIKDTGKPVKLSDFRGKVVAVDAMNMIYRNMWAMKDRLQNDKGKITAHVYITMNQIAMIHNLGIQQIWIFDSKKPSPLKKETIAQRKIKISSNEVEEIKEFLKLAGIPHIQVDDGVEAETYGAILTRTGMAAAMLSNDTDVLILGGKMLKVWHGKYTLYDGMEIRKLLNADAEKMIKIGVALGCDFAPGGIRGIGPKTVLAKLDKPIEFTDRQKAAITEFKKIIRPKREDLVVSKLDEEGLRKFLAPFSFNATRVTNVINKLKK